MSARVFAFALGVSLCSVCAWSTDEPRSATTEEPRAFDRSLGETKSSTFTHEAVKAAAAAGASKMAEERRAGGARPKRRIEAASGDFVRGELAWHERHGGVDPMRGDSGLLARGILRDQLAGSGRSDGTHGGGGGVPTTLSH